MNPNDVIEAYLAEVMRGVPRKDRNEIGLELRGLLHEMLAERAQAEGKPGDDAMVLALLRDFGSPADIAARYRSPGIVVIPAEQTRSFALLSLGGVGLQWALTLPRVFEGQPLGAWWFTWGLGSLWWPGFLAMVALAAAWIRATGRFKPTWQPRTVDPERIHRGPWVLGLLGLAFGIAFTACLPWIVNLMPDPVPRVFAFDPLFLHGRAPPVLLLWVGALALRTAVFAKGRWSPITRGMDIAVNLAFVALLGWWLAAGDIFQAKPTNDGAQAGIGLVILLILVDLACKLYRRRPRIHTPKIAG